MGGEEKGVLIGRERSFDFMVDGCSDRAEAVGALEGLKNEKIKERV